jgi:hypothetical protein
MTPTIVLSTLIALAIGALSDIVVVRNGLSSPGTDAARQPSAAMGGLAGRHPHLFVCP